MVWAPRTLVFLGHFWDSHCLFHGSSVLWEACCGVCTAECGETEAPRQVVKRVRLRGLEPANLVGVPAGHRGDLGDRRMGACAKGEVRLPLSLKELKFQI